MTILAEIITLNPGESQSVDFQIIPQEAGIYNVDVDGLSGSFIAITAVTAKIVSLSISPSSILTGGSFTLTVRWQNTGNSSYAFDIVGAYGEYIKGMEYYAGAVYNILAAPGEEKTTIVTVPTIEGDIGTFDVWATICDAKENSYLFVEKAYATKPLYGALTIRSIELANLYGVVTDTQTGYAMGG